MTLTEVLIAMGILTMGLLGVASLFPVASFYMMKADNADNGSAIAQSAMNQLVSMGGLDPRAWYSIVPSPASQTLSDPNYTYVGIDSKYAPHVAMASSWATVGTFTRPVSEAVGQSLKVPLTPRQRASQIGSAYVIDPVGAANYVITNTSGAANSNRYYYGFPASSIKVYPSDTANYYKSQPWNPWRATGAQAANQLVWPIRRATFRGVDGWHMTSAAAGEMFRSQDDLAYEFPDRDDRPARQLIERTDTNNDGITDLNVERQWTGDYSWLATVVPQNEAARDGMATSPQSFAYDVSVVVFYKRVLPSPIDPNNAITSERSVGAKIVSTGLNGGELLLWDVGDNPSVSPFADLKSGQWIMLCGPHPSSTEETPRFELLWYQVLAVDKDASTIITDPKKQRVITVRGPQWPWQPAASLSGYSDLSNDLCVGIFKGAVAVHRRTLHLDSTQKSASGGGSKPFGANSVVNANQPPWDLN